MIRHFFQAPSTLAFYFNPSVGLNIGDLYIIRKEIRKSKVISLRRKFVNNIKNHIENIFSNAITSIWFSYVIWIIHSYLWSHTYNTKVDAC